jgi:EpsG family
MLAYYGFLPVLILCALVESYIPLRVRVALASSLAVALGIFAGMRLIGIDNDSATYNYVFDYVSNPDFGALLDEQRNTSQEVGYLFYLKALYSIGFTYPATQLLLNVASGLMLCLFLARVSSRPLLGLLLYYFLFYYFRDFTQIRFCAASILSLWALYYWFIQERYRLAALIFAISISLHNSAIITLLPVLFSYFRVHESYIRIALISVVALAASFLKITTTILVALFNLPEQVLRYLDLAEDSRAGMMSIFLGLIIGIAVLIRNEEDRGRQFVFYALFSSFVAGMVFSDLSILLRMQLMLFTAVIVAPTYLRDSYGRILMIAVSAGAMYIHINNINENLLRPYQTWLFQ